MKTRSAVVYIALGLALASESASGQSPPAQSALEPVVGGTTIILLPHDAATRPRPLQPEQRVPDEAMPNDATGRMLFSAEGGRLQTGIFTAGVGKFSVKAGTRDEVDYIISGVLEVFDAVTKKTIRLRAGEHFATPRAFSGTVKIIEPVRVLFILGPEK